MDIKRIKKAVSDLQKVIDEEGLISIREASEQRNVSRSAILQLIQRKRLESVDILGKPMVSREQVKNFTAQKPGPSLDTIFKARSV